MSARASEKAPEQSPEQIAGDLARCMQPRGPVFYREGKTVMFRHEVDRRNVIGPRPATPEDEAAWPEAFAALAPAK